MTVKRVAIALLALVLALAAGIAAAESILASSKTTLEGSSKNKRNNVALAISAVDGYVLPDGGYFSFNDIVGPRSASYGYKSAPNGRGVKVIGGGVAQVATTIYLALKKIDGIDYDEKATYQTFTDKYVSSKKNAIMIDYKAGQDFSFYNNTGRDIRFDVWTSDNYVRCSLVALDWSTTGDTVTMYVPDELLNNVSLACDSIYDTCLEYGDTFSFNEIVGPRTARCGFVKGVDGRGAVVSGGGVDMVASAIYLSVKNLDSVKIVERTVCRGFNQSYVANAGDAIDVDYGDGVDFRFTYTGYGMIGIYTYVDRNMLYCEIEEY